MQKMNHSSDNFHYRDTAVAEAPRILQELVAVAGIQFNGRHDYDIQVHDEAFYRRVLLQGTRGFGEAYMDGLWDARAPDELFCRLMTFNIEEKLVGWARIRLMLESLRHRLFNLQSSRRAFQVGEQHYDIGNDIFEAMLDSSMSYSCAFWQHADNLEQAQYQKLDMICRKLELQPGEHLLDIGCGWGGLAYHAAKHYAVEVLGITVSKEQQRLAQDRCRDLPVRIDLMDYRDLQGKFDKVVSVGMFEHVGGKNYPLFFDIVADVMKADGLFLLQTIGNYKQTSVIDAWFNKYIFPNGKLPSAKEIASVLDNRFLIEDWHNFGPDYDRTLMAWWQNFDHAWPQLEGKYGQRFYRMWKYYLMSCAGFFRSRQGQLWQQVLSKRSRSGVYRSVR